MSGGSRRYRRPFAYVAVINGAGAEIERPRRLDEPRAGFCHILSLPLTDGRTERRARPCDHNDNTPIMAARALVYS